MTNETIRCAICDEQLEQEWFPDHVIRNHDDVPGAVRNSYPELYRSFATVVDEEFSSFEELLDIVEKDTAYISSVRDEFMSVDVSNEREEPDPPEQDPPDRTDPPEQDSPNEDESSGRFTGQFSLQNKWFFVGIGGCGGNLIDSVLLRTNALTRDGERRSQLWQDGLTDVVVLNTNEGELGNTIFARDYVDRSPGAVANDYLIGNGGGAGTDPMTGRKKWENEYEEHGDELFRGHWRRLEDVDVSEGVMVFHSVVKGTGTGVSSLFTNKLKADKLDGGRVFHFTVLPNPGRVTGDLMKRVNGLFGTFTVSQQAEAMIIVDNANLKDSDVTVELADYDEKKSGFKDENQTALALLEALTISSVVPGEGQEAIASGDMFDIEDAFKPVTRLAGDDSPAPVIAPAIRERDAPIESEKHLRKFVQNTLENGQLTAFDPETAWGGSFLFYGPKPEIDKIRTITNKNISPILRDGVSIDFEFTGVHPGPANEYFIDVDGMDSVRLCALMWNPRLDRLHDTRDDYEDWKHKLGDMGEFLEEREDQIDELFEHLGVEWFEK